MDIDRKVVVITGGASGIGKAVGKLMVNKGADKVFLADLNENLLNKTAEEIGAIPIVCDVSNEESRACKALLSDGNENVDCVDESAAGDDDVPPATCPRC